MTEPLTKGQIVEGGRLNDAMWWLEKYDDDIYREDARLIVEHISSLRAALAESQREVERLTALALSETEAYDRQGGVVRDLMRRVEKLREALRRLGSMEAFGIGGMATAERWKDEGEARMDFARAALAATPDPEREP